MAFLRGRKRDEEEEESDGERGCDSSTPSSKNLWVRRAGAEEAEDREAVNNFPAAQASGGWDGPWGRCTAALRLLHLLTLHF